MRHVIISDMQRRCDQTLIDRLVDDPRPLAAPATEVVAFELGEAILANIDASITTRDDTCLEQLHRNLWETFASWLRPGGPAVNFIDMSEYVALVLDALASGANPQDDEFLADYRLGLGRDLARAKRAWDSDTQSR